MLQSDNTTLLMRTAELQNALRARVNEVAALKRRYAWKPLASVACGPDDGDADTRDVAVQVMDHREARKRKRRERRRREKMLRNVLTAANRLSDTVGRWHC